HDNTAVRRRSNAENTRRGAAHRRRRTSASPQPSVHRAVDVLRQQELSQAILRTASWHVKPQRTFSDTIASVRRWLWRHEYFSSSLNEPDMIKIPRPLLNRFIDSLCYAA